MFIKCVNKRKIFYLTIFIIFSFWLLYSNVVVEKKNITIVDERIPEEFNGYKIAHISDLHNDGKKTNQIIKMLNKTNPDLIAITGDIIDSNHTNISVALEFVEKAIEIAPCYYVTGNHESWLSNYSYLKEELQKIGVVILDNIGIKLEKSNSSIKLLGVNDPSFSYGNMESNLNKINDETVYTILLSHRPELFDIYVKCGIDLVLTGHAHGGQIRLPFIGGLGAPDQGLFPKYDSGLYTEGDTNMIVSRGVGNSIIPIRFNNQPQLIIVHLKK